MLSIKDMEKYSEPFGNFLATVQERDIDILLLEEFHSSPKFVAWFSKLIGLQAAIFNGAWHSVCDADGETDLLLVVDNGEEKVGVFIENKVGATEQDRQDSRYHVRGERSVSRGDVDSYVTAICAPTDYLEQLSTQSEYQYRISYEEISGWFQQLQGTRSDWKRLLLDEAVEQRRRGSVMVKNPLTTQFHMEFWTHLKCNHPDILMNKPTIKGSKSNWIIAKMATFPKNTKIHFKFDQQQVELGFDQRSIKEIEKIIPALEPDMFFAQKGKTAAICKAMPLIVIRKPFFDQIAAIDEAIASARKLSQYSEIF